MAKLNNKNIEKSDIEEYAKNVSDFSFEMQVFNLVKNLGFYCEHGGTYEDPITSKPREFDIRAEYEDHRVKFFLAIEAKNLKENFPLVISCVPRQKDESYHEVIISHYDPDATLVNQMERHGFKKSILNGLSFYKEGDFVGKSSDQIGRHDYTGEIIANDSQIYDKWAQAVNSVYDLLDRAYRQSTSTRIKYASFAVPILVVPNNTLWQINYDENGNKVSSPTRIDRCPYFINKNYFVGAGVWGLEYFITHLEILTISGLKAYIKDFILDKNERLRIFPPQEIDRFLK